MNAKESNELPKWLKRLQENSWELELLISGGAIFSLFQLSDFYIDWIQHIRMTNHLPGAGILLMIGLFGIKILTLGFTLHLIFRGFWIALVCLNYVFVRGVNEEKLKWRYPFRKKQNGSKSLRDDILKVDHLCGTIMYSSIIAAFVILGFVICVVIGAIINVVFEDSDVALNIFKFLILGSLFHILDLILFSVFRRIPILSYFTYPILKFFDFITFRSFYQKSLWVFSTNVKKLKFSFAALLFCFTSLLMAYNSIYRVMHWPNLLDQREYRFQTANNHWLIDNHYMDEWDPESERWAIGLESKKITGNYMEFYLRYDRTFDDLIKLIEAEDTARFFSELIELKIDNTKLEKLDWLPTTKKSHNFGASCMVPLHGFKNGGHYLHIGVKKEYAEAYDDFVNRPKLVTIPFWIDRPQFIQPIIDGDSI